LIVTAIVSAIGNTRRLYKMEPLPPKENVVSGFSRTPNVFLSVR
jgi:hypothetical protein